MDLLRAALGVAFLCGVAWLFSSHRRRFPWRVVLSGLALQVLLGGLLLGTGAGRSVFQGMADFFLKLVGRTEPGARIVFGPLADPERMGAVFGPEVGYVFAFAGTGLPVLIFFSALMGILYHFGVMQVVIWALARLMHVTLGVSGAEAMAMAANVFVGQTEAPVVVRPYVPGMTLSELNAMMTGGFATIAGTVLAVYMGFLGEELGPHLLTASVMSAPAAFMIAKIMLPETETSRTAGRVELRVERTARNAIEAATDGTMLGLKLALNIVAMLIAFMGLVHLVNWPLGWMGEGLGLGEPLSLGRIFGWVFAPVAWLIGVHGWHDAQTLGSLLGTKISINEFVAFARMQELASSEHGFEHLRSAKLAAYALCGFANFGSIGIQIGGIAPLAPDRKGDLARLALRAMLGGAFASWTTAAVAGAFL